MGIMFFRKNRMDLDRANVTITVTDSVATNDGSAFTNYIRNRDNTSGWMTTGSTDAANSTLMVDLTDTVELDSILLVKHNFKAYTLKYWDSNTSAWTDFSTAVNVSANTATTTYHTFTKITTSKVQLIITAAMVTDADKSLCQMILTEKLGEFSFQPVIKGRLNKTRNAVAFLSGKNKIIKSVGGFEYSIEMNNQTSDTDLALVETLEDSFEGFLVWVAGNNSSQFPTQRIGFRLEDVFLMDCSEDLRPEWEDGRYAHGMPVSLSLIEVN